MVAHILSFVAGGLLVGAGGYFWFERQQQQQEEQQKQRDEERDQQQEKVLQEFEDYRENFRASLNEKWQDRQWEELVLADGSKLLRVRFSALEADGMRVIHSKGARHIAIADLPEILRKECGFYSEDAKARSELRHGQVAAHRNRLEQRRQRNQSAAEEYRVGETKREVQEMQSEVDLLREQIADLRHRRSRFLESAATIRSRESGQQRPNYVPADRLDQQAIGLENVINEKLKRVAFLESRMR